MFLDQTRRHLRAQRFGDRGRVFASKTKGFEEALTRRGGVDMQLAHVVSDNRGHCRRMPWRLVLDDLKRTEAGALIAASTDEQPSVRRRPKQDRARRRQVGRRIEVVRDPDCMAEDRRFDVIGGVDIDAANKMDQLIRLGAQMRASGVYGLSDEM